MYFLFWYLFVMTSLSYRFEFLGCAKQPQILPSGLILISPLGVDYVLQDVCFSLLFMISCGRLFIYVVCLP